MTMQTLYETNRFAWHYDRLMGVARFERKADKAITMLDTGTDCQLVKEMFDTLWNKAEANEITEERRDELFDSYAEEFTYEV